MKKTFISLVALALCLLAQASGSTNSIINFAWPVTGTAYSNAVTFAMDVFTNGSFYTNINWGSLTNVTVTNIPHFVQYNYLLHFYDSASNEIKPAIVGAYMNPPAAPPPCVQINVIQP